MAILFMEGFELNAATGVSTDQYFERKFENTSGTPGTSSGFLAGSSLQSQSYVFDTPEFTDTDVMIVHWAMKCAAVGNSGQEAGVRILRADTEQLRVQVRAFAGGSADDRFYLDIKRGATTLATAGPYFKDTWITCQLKVTIDPSAGAYELKVNDVTEVSGSGVNTADTGSADCDRVRFAWTSPTSIFMDHLLVADDAGSGVNDFPGEVLIVEALPDADGDDTDWDPSTGSTHFNLVNETQPSSSTASEDAERVSSSTVSDIDRWSMDGVAAAYGLPSGAVVLGVAVETAAAMEASGSRDLRAVFKDTTAATAEGTSFTVSDTGYLVYTQIWETNPATAASWTLATIDAGQFGVKVQA